MISKPLDLFDAAIGVEAFHGAQDRRVERPPPDLQQAAVGDLVGERVLEGVLLLGKETHLVQELRGLQARQALPRRVFVLLCDRAEKRVGYILADYRSGLEQPLI